MRLWSLHPKYLDPQGLVALWREALLAQAVLQGKTKGYQNHPQLKRFYNCKSSLGAIAEYLRIVHTESLKRGYKFTYTKISPSHTKSKLLVTQDQIQYEWNHLMIKLKNRNKELYKRHLSVKRPQAHPLFKVVPGDIEEWEKT